jgi:hypothetical protein
MIASLISIAKKGIKRESLLDRMLAPEKSAIAITGVKFPGCGISRLIAATKIIKETNRILFIAEPHE